MADSVVQVIEYLHCANYTFECCSCSSNRHGTVDTVTRRWCGKRKTGGTHARHNPDAAVRIPLKAAHCHGNRDRACIGTMYSAERVRIAAPTSANQSCRRIGRPAEQMFRQIEGKD